MQESRVILETPRLQLREFIPENVNVILIYNPASFQFHA